MKQSPWMTEDHVAYGDTVRQFLSRELTASMERWTAQGYVESDFWRKAGDVGILGASIPECYGGGGLDRTFDAVAFLEYSRTGDTGWGLGVHNIAAHYILGYGTEDQKKRWLPGLVSGQRIGAIAITEPGSGSDMKSISTRARKQGDTYRISGSKIFITNGQTANLLCVVTKTDPGAGSRGISIIVVDTEEVDDGFRRGRKLKKLGMQRQDTSELFFDELSVPAENLLGGVEGQGFYQLMHQLSWERLIIGFMALGACERALEVTLEYVKGRRAFQKRLMDFQNTRFKLAEVATKVEVLRAFVDQAVAEFLAGNYDGSRAAMMKWWATQTQCEIVDECLQLHGGYGYTMEYPIAELYTDARVQKIYGGTNEIMKDLIARSLDSK